MTTKRYIIFCACFICLLTGCQDVSTDTSPDKSSNDSSSINQSAASLTLSPNSSLDNSEIDDSEEIVRQVSLLSSALESAEKTFIYLPEDDEESMEDVAIALGTMFFEYLKEPHDYTFQVKDYRNLKLTDSGVWWEERFECWRCDFTVELMYSGEYGLIGPCEGWCADEELATGGVGIFHEKDGSYTMVSLAYIP